ncbi:SDR family oxidoreductase [Dactylosporangium sp. NPDC051541]|uniref:SDR family oxidoreductase n=1 Tax=Dactylosporangium sp. NPDC051541 TaxID=3363977 RepID=UPI0037953FF3
MHSKASVLVTGATGNVGRHVVAQLRAQGTPVTAFARTIEDDGVRAVRGDLTRPETIPPAETVFLLWRNLPSAAAPAVIDRLAVHAKRIVLLSSAVVGERNPVGEPNPIGELHKDLEDLVERAGVEWTFLRPGQFAANTLEWVPQIRGGDVVRGSHGDAALTLLHERDLAAVAVAALTGDGHAGQRYVLTGPEVHIRAGLVPIIARVLGRDLRWEEGSEAEERARMRAWMPAAFVDVVLASRYHRPHHTTTVEAILGAPARGYREWVEDHIADFRNAPPKQ